MLTLCLVVFLAQADAEAPSLARLPPSAATLQTDMMRASLHTYVEGERRSVIPWFVAAVSTGVAGGLLLTSSSRVARGSAFPLLTFSAFEILGGFIFFGRSFGLMTRLDGEMTADPKQFVVDERKHASRIVHQFQPLLLAVEAAIIATGGVLGSVGGARHDDTMAGVGIGLAVQGLVFFLIDWAVLDRAQAYESALDHFAP